jgi:ubiquinone/menaquinone biosynthesis C-methylase UbiE
MTLKGELQRASLAYTQGQILDLGTGTGIWAIEMAEKYPTAVVTSWDISPVQPNSMPPNYEFDLSTSGSPQG